MLHIYSKKTAACKKVTLPLDNQGPPAKELGRLRIEVFTPSSSGPERGKFFV
jgi:hypothetical protein